MISIGVDSNVRQFPVPDRVTQPCAGELVIWQKIYRPARPYQSCLCRQAGNWRDSSQNKDKKLGKYN